MAQYTVHLPQYSRSVPADTGSSLYQILRGQGILLDFPCGGNGTCGKCSVMINGKKQLACRTCVDQNMTVLLPESKKEQVLTSGSHAAWVPDGRSKYAMAFDVGTTTVVGYLLDGRTGSILATVSCPNPQREFGADVISRIQYALKENAARLQDSILRALGNLIAEASEKSHILPEQITLVSLVGNTCRICDNCAYPEPCRFPELACSSMEGYGLFVTDVCRKNGLPYYYGDATLTYTACFLF